MSPGRYVTFDKLFDIQNEVLEEFVKGCDPKILDSVEVAVVRAILHSIQKTVYYLESPAPEGEDSIHARFSRVLADWEKKHG